MFLRREGEVVKMDLYILSFCISIFSGETLWGDSFCLDKFPGSRFMFSRGEGEVVKMDLYILSFCISIFAGRRFMGTGFASWGVGLVGINGGGKQLGRIPISMGRVKMGKEYEKGRGPAQYLHQIYLYGVL